MTLEQNPKELTSHLQRLSEPLPIERVEFRVQSINNGGYATLLAYKDARVDMDRLDAVCGRGYWQRKHERIGNDLFCYVGIWNRELGEWVWVQDVGIPSNESAVKGEASDSFKRACFNLGIGRELYDYPLVQVKLFENEYKSNDRTGKMQATWSLRLKEWTWHMEPDVDEQGRATVKSLKGIDQDGKLRFSYPVTGQPASRQGDAYDYPRDTDQQQRQQPAASNQRQSSGQRSQQPQGQQRNNQTGSGGNRGQSQQGQRQQRGQGARRETNGNQLPWYDDFDKDKEYMLEDIRRGAATAESIIDGLKTNFRLNRKTEDQIRALES